MQFKVVPAVGPRYWVAISLASICGCNLGDVVPDVMMMSPASGLLLLATLFAAIVAIDRAFEHGSEASYWIAILVVRAAATELADLFIDRVHLSYLEVSGCLALLLVVRLAVDGRPARMASMGDILRADGSYWLTMLTAGTLGTVVADGIGHTIRPVTIGVPASAAIATVAVALILSLRRRTGVDRAGSSTYWAAIVAIRVWGTSVGDIAAFLVSLPLSLTLSGIIFAVTLLMWRKPSKPAWPVATEHPLS